MNKLEEVINTSKYVVNKAKHVKINEEEIKNLVKQLKIEKTKHWLFSNPFGLLDLDIKETTDILLYYGSIVCLFWGEPKWTIVTEENKELDGSFALLYALIKLQKEKGHLDFEQISFLEFKETLKGNVSIPLLEERYKVVSEVSKIINKKMNGNFYEFTKEITSDLELFELIIDNFPSFEDTRNYDGKIIYFYKLAQYTVANILNLKKIKENTKVDYSHLVGCADYKIPQVLRGLNMIVYDEELSLLVDSKTEIKENSIYEVEIRASMIIAIDMIKEALKNKMCAIDINDIIWSLGQDKTKNFKPYHRTRTMSY